MILRYKWPWNSIVLFILLDWLKISNEIFNKKLNLVKEVEGLQEHEPPWDGQKWNWEDIRSILSINCSSDIEKKRIEKMKRDNLLFSLSISVSPCPIG